MTFEEFFKRKKIDLPELEKAEASLFSEFRNHFEQMGEKSFDHTKKYWFNKLRRQYPLAPEVKTERIRIENPLAEQTITESLLEEGAAKPAAPKPGFTPRFRATAVAPKTEEEKTTEVSEKIDLPETTEPSAIAPPKPAGFTPRFKAAVPPKAAEENTEPAPTTDQPEIKEPTASPAKPAGFTPRFKASTPPKKVADPTDKKPVENSEPSKEETPALPAETPAPQSYKPRFKPQMLPKKPEE